MATLAVQTTVPVGTSSSIGVPALFAVVNVVIDVPTSTYVRTLARNEWLFARWRT